MDKKETEYMGVPGSEAERGHRLCRSLFVHSKTMTNFAMIKTNKEIIKGNYSQAALLKILALDIIL